MKKATFFVLAMLTLCAFTAGGDAASTIPVGEKLVYTGSYNMSGLMTQLAQVTLSTETMSTSKKTFLHLNCELSTFAKWDKFFKIRDIYESYVDPSTLKPNLYKRSIDEGGYTKKEKYIFKGNTVNSTVKRRNGPEKTNAFAIASNTQDVISMLYKLRSMDLSKMKTGQMHSLMVVFDEKQIPVTVKLLGTESVSAGNLGQKNCYKLAIGARTDALKGKDKNLIWLTADDKKIPALMKFSIPVGTGQLALTSASGI